MSEHAAGRWCDDLHCGLCYSASTWQNSRIAALEAELKTANERADVAFEIAAHEAEIWDSEPLSGRSLAQEIRKLQSFDAAKVMESSRLYYELLYTVAKKRPGESRHETVLRYIRHMEEPSTTAMQATKARKP